MKQLASTRTPVRPTLLALGVALATLGSTAQAATWQVGGDWSLTTNTTLTLGTSWALEDADKGLLTKADAASIGKVGRGINYNGDDGKLNFEKGDTISTVFKGLSDFDLNDGSQGAFVRFKYWYDHALETGDGDFREFDDSGWQDLARFKGFEVLDAYAWKDFEIAERRLGVKVGKQVLSWGEALFLQNGINAINPLDVSAFNRPGVELKEGQLPVEMLSFNFDLADSLSVEGFWQYNFRPSVLDGCGTFFSGNDNVQEGCQFDAMIGGGLATTDITTRPDAGALPPAQRMLGERYLQRTGTDWARDTGQYGLALHYVIEALNDADLGLYYANYHSRTPQLNGVISRQAPLAGGNPGTNLNTGDYYTVYPENIRLFGTSISGVVGSTAVFGELSYRPNLPLGYNPADLVGILVGQATTPIQPMTPAELAAARGSTVEGYKRKEVWQFSLGATDTVSNVLGAQRLAWAGEIGANWIGSLDPQDERYGRAGSFGRTPPTDGAICTAATAFGAPGGLSAAELAAYNADNCNTDGLMTDFSWGYRLRLALNYEDLLPATVITPSLNWRHDVEGNGPNFQEGQQAAGLALTFDYRNNYSLELAYNAFFGSNEFSTIDDRDFASVTVKASF
ncbi:MULTISPECIES: DUF1302 domain-containing protein [unclassified Pseudomonas]|uniref:DUF1302 domain-containing protein n=1 Tax=unclassified Pseudomonas TaxID=196821 RepID=UPI0024484B09|nr:MULTISPECIES: DUF1302 domain-containing protein [unclassified Pseudomonas]MDG9925118.1 DUF1302 domain-containing protein [Pseudomonas sp. GD04045]MDH0037007.1 DUF1302 domain-containing protein [Pseudomonas sp. GD04019]